ncbi:hypothetical protein KSP40_PGU008101 [Platanthera guangdongensis]|uniref:Uncharacterized protein n=1 Tax=Platanthera guangdongensis TaxID=2320717 RepID=A0ABR2LNZ7_9ASPA
MMVAFASYLRRERIEFNLTVFRKLFSYKATSDGVASFGGSLIKVREIANKHHTWMTKFAFIKGDLGNIPYSPQQKGEEVYRPPAVSGNDAELHKYFLHKDFEVAFLRRGLDALPPVLPDEGTALSSSRQAHPICRVRHTAAEFLLTFSKYFLAGERIIPVNRHSRTRGYTPTLWLARGRRRRPAEMRRPSPNPLPARGDLRIRGRTRHTASGCQRR